MPMILGDSWLDHTNLLGFEIFFLCSKGGSFFCLHFCCLVSHNNPFAHNSWQNVHSFVYWWVSSFLRSHEAVGYSIVRTYGTTKICFTNTQLDTPQLCLWAFVCTPTLFVSMLNGVCSLFEGFFSGISVHEKYQQCMKFSRSGSGMSSFNQFRFVLFLYLILLML